MLQDTVLSFYVFIASVLSCLLLYVIYQISVSLHAISCLVGRKEMSFVCFSLSCIISYCIRL